MLNIFKYKISSAIVNDSPAYLYKINAADIFLLYTALEISI